MMKPIDKQEIHLFYFTQSEIYLKCHHVGMQTSTATMENSVEIP